VRSLRVTIASAAPPAPARAAVARCFDLSE
jgi:hypothetical protein